MDKYSRRASKSAKLFNKEAVKSAAKQSFIMLNPKTMVKNPVMFITEIGAFVSTLALIFGDGKLLYTATVTFVLWLTVLFANFAESLAEARGKAQAESLKRTRSNTKAKLLSGDGVIEVLADQLKTDDIIIVSAGEIIASDGEIIEGAASVDESAITGESAPVVREAGGDRSGVTGGTRVLSDVLKIRITAGAGESFLDKMIQLVEGAVRQKSPNELALTVTLAGMSLAFLLVTVTLYPIALYFDVKLPIPTLVALLVCLIPTTIGALLAAIGLAGMDKALSANIIAKSGKAVELAGDIDTLLLDKTGTITLGDRKATNFIPVGNVERKQLLEASILASFGDITPEGKSIAEKAEEFLGGTQIAKIAERARVIPFEARTSISGVDLPDGTKYRKGASHSMRAYIEENGGKVTQELQTAIDNVAKKGATPIVLSEGGKALGVIELSDILKPGISERFASLRAMGLRVVMVTGDNPLTAAAIAKEAGVDDFIAEAKPEDKLEYIRKEQRGGRLVAMMGDGTNDAPALAQADIGIAMNSGTQAAKEAGNMVDLDSDPTKLIEVIEIGKQLLMTRGSLTTFSLSNDVAKYFAIIPAVFTLAIPELAILNIMGLATPETAVLSALIFNAIIIPFLIPVAIKGVRYLPLGADALLRKNLLIFGLGGMVLPFICIKLIDMVISTIGVF